MLTRTLIPYDDPIRVFAAYRDEPYALLLHGAGRRWSYICLDPITIVEMGNAEGNDPLGEVEQSLKALEMERPSDAPPFCGGWAGLLSFELGRSLLPKLLDGASRRNWPDIALGLYDQVAVYDHDTRSAEVFVWDWGGRKNPSTLAEQLSSASGPIAPWLLPLCVEAPCPRIPKPEYAAKIARTVDYVHAGDCFQSNISQAFDFELASGAHPLHLTQRLDMTSAAPFSAYLRLNKLALASNSPERFLKVRPSIDGKLQVSTKPIKGTRPRGKSPVEDKQLADELLASEKDRAENLMIVDLMRNDLSRVSDPGSVKVPKLNALESYANVHHLVSTVTSTLSSGFGLVDLLRAAFPGGSVTGAPKIRAIQIISEMEEDVRGPYCGSLVWMTPDGFMDSSILIRSTAFEETDDGWKGEFRVGGGIVADSTPEDEYQETLDKGRALIRALTARMGETERPDAD